MPNDDIYDGSSNIRARQRQKEHTAKSSLRGIFVADLPLHAACNTLWQEAGRVEEEDEEEAKAAAEPC